MTRLEAARQRHAHDDVAGDNQFWQPPGYGNAGLRAHEDRAYLLGLVDELAELRVSSADIDAALKALGNPANKVEGVVMVAAQATARMLARLETT